jgi:hypothetical protein
VQVFFESWLESPLPQLPQWAKVGERLRLRSVRVSRMYFIELDLLGYLEESNTSDPTFEKRPCKALICIYLQDL